MTIERTNTFFTKLLINSFNFFQEHTGRVFRLQFDDFQIVSSSHDDTILIWDFLNTGTTPRPRLTTARPGPYTNPADAAHRAAVPEMPELPSSNRLAGGDANRLPVDAEPEPEPDPAVNEEEMIVEADL